MTPVTVVPYNPDWPKQFENIKSDLETLLKDIPIISIEHVGSTSIPSLSAKPILDIDIIVPPSLVHPAISALTTPTAGYVYMGEWGIPDRHALRTEATPERNLYVVVDGCVALKNHLGVREVLRKDERLRREYEEVKRNLAERGLEVDEYCELKSEVLGRILEKAGLGEEEREGVRRVNLVGGGEG
jgi:GrpB-like predicted nucleotidyltransferase (UPF0157 family)